MAEGGMMEFSHGDRVRWNVDAVKRWMEEAGTADVAVFCGTVVDETVLARRGQQPMGSFEECLPLPVAVAWDEPGETWWSPGLDLELVKPA